MQYLVLLYAQEDERSDPTSEAFAQDLARYDRFSELAGPAIVGGEALEPSDQGVTLRHRDGEVLLREGPYPETTEVMGGFFVLEAEDLDAALALAEAVPAADHGAVEVRPAVEWSQDGPRRREGDRRYLALLVGEETDADRPGTLAWDRAVEEHERFTAEAGDAIVGGAALHPAESATTVRVRDGRTLLREGPFIETAEVIGGLYLLSAASREEAIDLASRIPVGPQGTVELRPVMEFDDA